MDEIKTSQKIMLLAMFGILLYASLQRNRLMLNGSSFLILIYLFATTFPKKDKTKVEKYAMIALPILMIMVLISTLLVYKSGNFYF